MTNQIKDHEISWHCGRSFFPSRLLVVLKESLELDYEVLVIGSFQRPVNLQDWYYSGDFLVKVNVQCVLLWIV